MKKIIYLIFLAGALLFLVSLIPLGLNKNTTFQLLTTNKTYTAGNSICLQFYSPSIAQKPQLFLVHSYGKTLLQAVFIDGKYNFKIPKNYCKKSGTVSWFLINNNETCIAGTFEILPNNNTTTLIENYLGPRTILAGKKEFSMIVVVPTDSLDNPKADKTMVVIKHQFLENITTLNLPTQNFIAWHNIYSGIKSGKMLVSSGSDTIVSKEIETEIYPNIPTNFGINYSRNHAFADGNQITHFTTTSIKDQLGNTVSDGTMVTFIITTKNNLILKTFGTTINGVASAQILAPDHQEVYKVKAYITGIASSNWLTINYKPIITTFNYYFSNNNRIITVGPIKSFMNQLVPDGIKVVLKIFDKNTLVTTLQKDSYKGLATFVISQDFYTAKKYRFEITTLGITKQTNTINYGFYK